MIDFFNLLHARSSSG